MSQVYLTHPQKEKKKWWNIILIGSFGIVLGFVYLLHVNSVAMSSKELRNQEEVKLSLIRDIHSLENEISAIKSINEISRNESVLQLEEVKKTIIVSRIVPKKLAMNK